MLSEWIDNRTFTWLVTDEIIDEYKTVLARRKVRPNLIAATISLIRRAAEEIPAVAGRDISPDPLDEPFCACAEAKITQAQRFQPFLRSKNSPERNSSGWPLPVCPMPSTEVDRHAIIKTDCPELPAKTHVSM